LDSPFCIVITLTLVIVIMLAFSRAFAFFLALFSSLLLTARSCQFHGHGLNLSSIDYRSMIADNVSTRFLRRREISSTRVAVHNVRVFDGSVLLPPSTVVIDGGFICRPCTACEACPPTDPTPDCDSLPPDSKYFTCNCQSSLRSNVCFAFQVAQGD
jgi:hypothetical protein